MKLTSFLALVAAALAPVTLAAVPHARWGLEKKQDTGKLVFAHVIVSVEVSSASYMF